MSVKNHSHRDIPAARPHLPTGLEDVTALIGTEAGLTRLGAQHYSAFSRHGDTLIVTFETLQGIMTVSPLSQPLGWEMAKRHGWSSLSMISHGDTWFRDDSVMDAFDRLADAAFFDGFSRVLFYGAGSCAHAAAAFSVAAPGADVLVIQPQASLDTRVADWDTRFTCMRRADFSSRYGYAPAMLDAARLAWVLYDPLEREDAMHATLFRAEHVTLLPLRGMGTALQTDLWQMQILHDMIAAAAQGALTPVGFARMMRARRNHLPYLHRLLRHLEREDRDGLLRILCAYVTERMDAPRFARHLERRIAAQ